MMRIEIISKNYKESERLLNILEKKLAKLDKYFSDEADANVKLSITNGEKFTMEVTIRGAGKTIRSETTSDNMYDNIDILLPKLERQIAKNRNRYEKGKRGGYIDAPVVDEPEVGQYGKVVKVKRFDISITTVDDAIAEMELLDHTFHIFVNADTNKVSVVYKRDDGDYGLITPEY